MYILGNTFRLFQIYTHTHTLTIHHRRFLGNTLIKTRSFFVSHHHYQIINGRRNSIDCVKWDWVERWKDIHFHDYPLSISIYHVASIQIHSFVGSHRRVVDKTFALIANLRNCHKLWKFLVL